MTTEATTSRLDDLRNDAAKIQQEIAVLAGKGEDFTHLVGNLADLIAKIKKSSASENAEKINDAKDQIVAVLKATLDNSKLGALIGAQVTKVYVEWVPKSGDTPAMEIVRINGKSKTGSGGGGGSRGPRRPLKAVFEKFATDADKKKLTEEVNKAEATGDSESHAEYGVRDEVYKRLVTAGTITETGEVVAK